MTGETPVPLTPVPLAPVQPAPVPRGQLVLDPEMSLDGSVGEPNCY